MQCLTDRKTDSFWQSGLNQEGISNNPWTPQWIEITFEKPTAVQAIVLALDADRDKGGECARSQT